MQGKQDFITASAPAIAEAQLRKATDTLMRYKAGKSNLENRLVANEQWWKMRHWEMMQENSQPGEAQYTSAWLFNVIISKHADGIQNYPQANILPREEGDKKEAQSLSDIIPCILEQNDFEEVYSDVLWQKLKAGTGVYGIFWDKEKLGGLGDVAIRKMDLLNMFWEPGVTDIQKSRNVFVTEMADEEALKEQYPFLEGKSLSDALTPTKYQYDDHIPTDGKCIVVSWYYKKWQGGKQVVHYCRYVGEHVLFATENEAEFREVGLYDHGKYPFVFDRLFPVEGSPCGFGYIDVCKDAQEQIDILNQGIVKNALMGCQPRYFVREDGSINEEEFADWRKPLVHVDGNLGQDSLLAIAPPAMNDLYVTIMNNKIQEMKEVSGNTDVSNGTASSGVTAASAIAALQEASGKTSRSATMGAYRAFCRLTEMVIDLIRQFYDAPRQFRITGSMGQEEFVSYDNSGIKPQQVGMEFGVDMGYRMPVFDIKVSAQSKNIYTQNSQNELALQLYGQGVFNPQNVDQALMLLETMDFDGREEIMQRVAAQGGMYQQLIAWQQMALSMAQKYEPQMAEGLAQSIMGGMGAAMPAKQPGAEKDIEGITLEDTQEHAVVRKAREQSREASQA